MKRAIVTGATGFLGMALCGELVREGVQVTAVVRKEDARAEKLKRLPDVDVVCCELSRMCELADRVGNKNVDVMYHLAWNGTSGKLRGDSDVQTDNVKYTCDAIRACAEMNCKRFVFAASIMEYEVSAMMETAMVPDINTVYSTAKLAADYMARAVAGVFGISYIRAVISNIYGPGEKSPRLINTCIRKLLKGEHCSFSKGEQMYDFIYVEDAAKAFAAVGKKGKTGRTYYIGSLAPRPLKEFLEELGDQIAPEVELGFGELPFQGVSLTYKEFDIHALMTDTGFTPQVSFRQGISRTAEWMRRQG